MSNPLSWDEKIAFEIRQKDVMIKHLKSKVDSLEQENEELRNKLIKSKKACKMWYTKFTNLNEKYEKHVKWIGWCK